MRATSRAASSSQPVMCPRMSRADQSPSIGAVMWASSSPVTAERSARCDASSAFSRSVRVERSVVTVLLLGYRSMPALPWHRPPGIRPRCCGRRARPRMVGCGTIAASNRRLHTDSMNVKGRKAAQSEQTRRLLLDVARDLFAERGYAGTATEEVVQRAGVTRGALYYHFRDKQDLFRGVVEDLEAANVRRFGEIVAAITDPWEQLHAGINAFLDACMDPAVQRILL